MIECKDLCKTYNDKKQSIKVKAVDGVSLTIPDSSFISITGKSGSGKSTLLGLLGTVISPTKGTLVIDGVNVTELSADRLSEFRNKNIGFVYQSFLLEDSLTTLENTMLPALISGKKKRDARERALELLERVGLSGRLTHKTSALSGGERQRVSIARALINDPSIILADEPTGNLDEKTGKQVMDLLIELSKEKKLVLVTHDKEIASLASQQVVLKDGQIEMIISD